MSVELPMLFSINDEDRGLCDKDYNVCGITYSCLYVLALMMKLEDCVIKTIMSVELPIVVCMF